MALDLVFLDFETFWSQTHSLTKMNPLAYVMHPETEIISLSIAVGNSPVAVAFGERDVRALMGGVDWGNAWVIAHNMSGFDAMILAWRLGVRPAMWGDTLAMARPIHGATIGLSLAKLVEYYGVGHKDKTALVNTRGKHLADFTAAERQAMAVYNKADTDQCRALFKKLAPYYDAKEFWHINAKVRALVEPKFVLDVPMLTKALAEERANKRAAMLELAHGLADHVLAGTDGMPVTEDYLVERVRATLASAPMFAAVLSSRQVPVPTKPSPTDPTKLIPALAKTDEAFLALQDHDDPVVAAAASARLAVKSTQAETRMQLFLDAAEALGGRWPVPVNYCGAGPGRATGWMYNPLNLPRVDKKNPRPRDALRMSIMAPEGHVVCVADSSAIEMRVNHFLWRVPYTTRLWRDDPEADAYKAYAVMKYDLQDVGQVTPEQRQAAKIDQLGLGYGMGKDRYQDTARIQGGLELTIEEAELAVATWRGKHPEITRGWKTCDKALSWILEGMERPVDPGNIVWTCAAGLKLPSGRLIRYPDLRRESDCTRENGWVYGQGRNKSWVYGAKADENIVQALARDMIYDVAWRVFQRTGLYPSLEVYDELAYVVPEDDGDKFLSLLQEEMRAPVSWFPGIVLWSKGDFGARYGALK